jgi:hypothetical protein
LPFDRLSRAVLADDLAGRPAHPGLLAGGRAAEGVEQPRRVGRRCGTVVKHPALGQVDDLAADGR